MICYLAFLQAWSTQNGDSLSGASAADDIPIEKFASFSEVFGSTMPKSLLKNGFKTA